MVKQSVLVSASWPSNTIRTTSTAITDDNFFFFDESLNVKTQTNSAVAGQKFLGGPNLAERAKSRGYRKLLKFSFLKSLKIPDFKN